jgi:hypothetical protein
MATPSLQPLPVRRGLQAVREDPPGGEYAPWRRFLGAAQPSAASRAARYAAEVVAVARQGGRSVDRDAVEFRPAASLVRRIYQNPETRERRGARADEPCGSGFDFGTAAQLRL